MTGTVVGGWEFVAAAYAVTFLALCAYSYSVLHRYRRERRRASRERLS
jgi:hypothetical protein